MGKLLLSVFALLALACLASARKVAPENRLEADLFTLDEAPIRYTRPSFVSAISNDTGKCELCVGFMGPAVTLLAAALAGGGAVACPDLCGKAFPNGGTDETICEALCYIVGITAFSKLIVDGDPDPVWICEMLNMCAYNDNDTATIKKFAAHPSSGVQGRNFTFHIEWYLAVWDGVADLNITVLGPGGAGTFQQNYYTWTQGVTYSMDIALQTKPSKGDPWTPGEYEFIFQLCEGDCGCRHAQGCKTVVQKSLNFTIKPNPKTTTVATIASATSGVVYTATGGSSGGAAMMVEPDRKRYV